MSRHERLVSEQDLIEFCREQSAKCPYCNKLEVEQYLRSFQSIAGPLVKMQEITTAKRDFYFVSGIPSSIKNWFIEHVPESQRKRSNPIPLADSVGILYDYFDPDALLPGLWNDIDDKSAPRQSSPSPAPPAPISSCITSLPPTPIHLDTPSSSTTISATARFALDASGPHTVEEISTPLECIGFSHKDISADDETLKVPPSANPIDSVPRENDTSSTNDRLKIPPSDELPENVVCRVDFGAGKPRIIDRRYEERPVYFCAMKQATDRISEPVDAFDQDPNPGSSVLQDTELSADYALFDPDFNATNGDRHGFESALAFQRRFHAKSMMN
ncbi:hypothetical protein B0H10DRAFT_904384 [Mycena sp. CBHHK59/15]|nr:hypothetical protein B0H10DRAFT_904384 [Mycena sp. CBHHK59/15]